VRLREWGAQEVLLLEMPNVYDRFYGNRSVAEVAEYFGFASPNYRVVDGSIDPARVVFDRGLVASSMCRAWYEASVRIDRRPALHEQDDRPPNRRPHGT